jgi:threonine aldolase
MVCMENTHNGAGGMITPLEELRALHDLAKEHQLGVHLDGARLWNASVASGTSLPDFASCADTVMVSFSKGLGAPVGAALAGPADLMEEGWTVRKRFGGGMRQSGILAAAVLHSLDHHIDRLADDHANARAFSAIVDGAAGASVVPPDTNIVMIDLPPSHDAFAVVAACAERGVLTSPWSSSRIRAVFHLDVDAGASRKAGEVVREALTRGG